MIRQFSMRRSASAVLAFAVAAGLTSAPTASAQPADPTVSPSVVARHVLTLVTGDVVELDTLSNGQRAATVRPAPGRDDRDNSGYATHTVGDQFYLVPHDAFPLLAAGRLDHELFNLTGLVAAGYDDASSATIPLIVQYEPGRAAATAAPPGTTARFTLESINARSVHEDKSQAG